MVSVSIACVCVCVCMYMLTHIMSMVCEWVGVVMCASSIPGLGRTRNVPLGLPVSFALESSLLEEDKGVQDAH